MMAYTLRPFWRGTWADRTELFQSREDAAEWAEQLMVEMAGTKTVFCDWVQNRAVFVAGSGRTLTICVLEESIPTWRQEVTWEMEQEKEGNKDG